MGSRALGSETNDPTGQYQGLNVFERLRHIMLGVFPEGWRGFATGALSSRMVSFLKRMLQRIHEKVRLPDDSLSAFLNLSPPTGPRLHLGCGENYLEGYVNIDLPLSEHTVMRDVRPDVYADLREIHFRTDSIALVRSHHVFEHFDRPTALVMLIKWYRWLTEGGVVVIETPDFGRAATRVLSDVSSLGEKLVSLRHIFGSHEASWAFHLDGWFKGKFMFFLERLGYHDIQVIQFSNMSLDNIIVKAHKARPVVDLETQIQAAEELLWYGLVSPEKEQPLFGVWRNKLRECLIFPEGA